MSTDLNYPNVVDFAVPGFIALILIELAWITLKHRGGRYEARDAVTSLFMGAGNVAAGLIFGVLAWWFFMWVWHFRLFDLGASVWVILLALVLDDLRYYWVHRFGHRIRWVWASHVNHHSSQHYNLTTALRQTWTGTFTLMMVVRVPLILIGIHPAILVFTFGLNLIYQFWIHTEAIGKMPRWFEAVMNTPSHHRVHHGRNPRYLDANYAGIFIIWDRMFGTFVPELEEEAVEYGLVRNLGTFNPLRVAFHEWFGILRDIARPGIGLKSRLLYALAPPGWSHDGSRDTTAVIKAKYLAHHPEATGTPGLDGISPKP